MTIKEAESIVGSLSKPSKMPCYGYSIPAKYCKIGHKMVKIKGSICSKCYALKGRYIFPNVMAAMEKRFESLQNPKWADVMVELIKQKEKSGFFRWHDSGDLQGEWHLDKIAEIARRLPQIKFWLPTREYNIANAWLNKNDCPENLTIRFSALMIEGQVKESQNPHNLPISEASEDDWNCPSSLQHGKCWNCRLCWNKNCNRVAYKLH